MLNKHVSSSCAVLQVRSWPQWTKPTDLEPTNQVIVDSLSIASMCLYLQPFFFGFFQYWKMIWKTLFVQAHKVCQLGQDVCSAGNTFEKDS